MRRLFVLLLCSLLYVQGLTQALQPPDKLYGPLFRDVQLSGIFKDNKTFVDAVPRQHPDSIKAQYLRARERSPHNFDLLAFVNEHFIIPGADSGRHTALSPELSVTSHINQLWELLQRKAGDTAGYSSLLSLPYPYIVPGGRFREIYYWDSYFTMLGLEESGRISVIENMIRNFAFLIEQYGHIPNGNRTYFLSRSQPPFFALMIDLLARHKGDSIYRSYLPALEKEYAYWMDRSAPTQHVVEMPDGSRLNRYYDQENIPRQESYQQDMAVASGLQTPPPQLFRDLRSAAESGWDFSSRWFGDNRNLSSIRTTSLVPVDLNSLLYHLEKTLARAQRQAGQPAAAHTYDSLAAQRRRSIEKYCWSAKAGWYVDYDLEARRPATARTLAGMFPFFLRTADKKHIAAARLQIERSFLQPGGVVTTLVNTGQQWDFPNGWAPLQWVTVSGLENYGASALARKVAERWIALNVKVYHNTGKLTEKYNVVDLSLPAGGGEYPNQDGFGWTNGVLLKLMDEYRYSVKQAPAK